MSRTIIFLSGRCGSGKDTLYEHYFKTLGFRRIAFADVLKQRVSDEYNIPLVNFYKYKDVCQTFIINDNKIITTPRQILINYVKDDTTVIINPVKKILSENRHDNFVITDFRRHIENIDLDPVDNKKIFIWIERTNVPDVQDNIELNKSMNIWDYVIENNGTINDMVINVNNLINRQLFNGKNTLINKVEYFTNE